MQDLTRNLQRQAQFHNWDEGLECLERILANRACDQATALMLYWHGSLYMCDETDPLNVPSYNREIWCFVKRLQQRLLNKEFKNFGLHWNPKQDPFDNKDWTSDLTSYERAILLRDAPELFEPVGKPVQRINNLVKLRNL